MIQTTILGQNSDGFISSNAFRIEQAYNVNPNRPDTLDYTDFFTKEDGFIIIINYANSEGIFSVDKGSPEHLMFIGSGKTIDNSGKNDPAIFKCDYMAGGIDSMKNVTITKQYIEDSLEDFGEKAYFFRILCKNDGWAFIATEIITGKKDL